MITLTKQQTKTLFGEFRDKIEKIRDNPPKVYSHLGKTKATLFTIKDIVCRNIQLIKHGEPSTDDKVYFKLTKKILSFAGEYKPLADTTYRKYLAYAESPEKIDEQPGNSITLNFVAILLGYLGLKGFIEEPQIITISKFLSDKGIRVEDLENELHEKSFNNRALSKISQKNSEYNDKSLPNEKLLMGNIDELSEQYFFNLQSFYQERVLSTQKLHEKNRKEKRLFYENLYNTVGSELDNISSKEAITDKEEYLKSTFNMIIEPCELNKSVKNRINRFLNDSEENKIFKWYDRSLITSALTISILRYYDEGKADYLLRLFQRYESDSISGLKSDVKKKALIGLVLGMLKIYNNKERVKIHEKRIIEIFEIKWVREILSEIVQLIVNLDFKKIDNKYLKNDYFNESYRYFIPYNENIKSIQNALKKGQKNVDAYRFHDSLSHTVYLSGYNKYYLAFCYPSFSKDQVIELTKKYDEDCMWMSHDDDHYSNLAQKISFTNILDELNCAIINNKNLGVHLKDLIPKTRSEKLNFLDVVSESFYNYYVIGEFYYFDGNYQTALPYFKKHEKWFPDHMLNLAQIGYCLQEQGEFKEALKYHQKAEAFDSENIWNLRQLGCCLLELGEFKKALEYFYKIGLLEPNSTFTLIKIGQCLRKQSEFKKALEYFYKANKNEPDDGWILLEIGCCLSALGIYKKALKLYHQIVRDNYSNTRLLVEIGYSLDDMGHTKRAIEHCLKVEKIDSKNVENLVLIGWCYFKLGNLDFAISYIRRTLTIDENNELALMNFGHVRLCKKQMLRAVKYYRTSIDHWKPIQDFFKCFDEDFTYIERYNVSQYEYQKIKEELERYCKDKHGKIN